MIAILFKNASIKGSSGTEELPRGPSGEMCGCARGRTVLTLVRQARRRLFNNELLTQGANASSAALIAFILLLLLGTQILSWQWAVMIPVAAAGAGLYIARQKLPSLYRVAQLIDARLALCDT